MEIPELLEIIARGEDSKHQFKANVTNQNSLAAEMVAFSNSGGGRIFIGVSDDGTFAGLTRDDISRLNQLVSNAASQSVRPPVNPITENVATTQGLVMAVNIRDGVSKPYMDNSGFYWVKSGADKRKVTAREEVQRMFQEAGLIHGDAIPVGGLTIADLDVDHFKAFYERANKEPFELQDLPLPTLLRNMNLMVKDDLNVSGALLFAKNPNYKLPIFIVKAISYPGVDIHEHQYLDSRDITGNLSDIFLKSLGFILGNLKHVQADRNVNAPGEPEIPRISLEELLANAFIHRDYFISAPIRIFIYRDRVEIISPGHLPNNLTIENIKSGNSNVRNPILASYAPQLLPYRGHGKGIPRALRAYPDIDFQNDVDGNQFKVIIKRPAG